MDQKYAVVLPMEVAQVSVTLPAGETAFAVLLCAVLAQLTQYWREAAELVQMVPEKLEPYSLCSQCRRHARQSRHRY